MDVARSDTVGEPPVSTLPGPPAERRRALYRELPLLLAVALALTFAVRLLVVQAFYIPSVSMQPTLEVGDRLLVSKVAYRVGDITRGDVIVFDGRGSFAPLTATSDVGAPARVAGAVGGFLGLAPSERDYVKRVIGLPGDRVVCCGVDGRLTVNGVPLDEPYLFPADEAGVAAGDQPFDVLVPAGRLWVMGDHRDDSADSRAHLGDPGGGTVPVDRVVGEAVLRFWPFSSAGRPAGAGS